MSPTPALPISVCLLTFNSARTLRECLAPLVGLGEDLVVVDSGSRDDTLAILAEFGITPHHRAYDHHSNQMNYAVDLARHDWVLCVDSDEALDPETVANLRAVVPTLDDPQTAYRITRHWFVLGRPVRALYPISSPDRPVRLFNRTVARFNGAPVDDKPVGQVRTRVIPGAVRHDTFPDLHELFRKLNDYTTRLARHRPPRPSLLAAFTHAPAAFVKWYLWKGAYRDGDVGLVTGVYAAAYTFLKYFKAWYRVRGPLG